MRRPYSEAPAIMARLWLHLDALALLFVVAVLAGCASGLKAAYASLATTERLVVAAAEELPRFDAIKQAEINTGATSRENGRKQLDEWRATRAKLEQGINGAHASVQLTRDAIVGIEKGVRDPRELVNWAAVAIRVYQDLMALLRAVGVHLEVM